MSDVTVQQVALRMLRYIGVTQFTPQNPGSELESLGPGDLEDVANAMSGALQEMAGIGPAEAKEAPGYGILNAPANLTLTCTSASTAISGVTTWLPWMQGCTVRISGDSQDNEFLSQTKLARAYLGPTGGQSGTVYGDCITLDDTIGKIIPPLWLPNQLQLFPATNRQDYMRSGMYSMVSYSFGSPIGWPYYLYYQKPIGPPLTWFIDAAYDASLGYTQRRIRFCPMPPQQYSVAYTAGINPPRVTPASIVSPLTTLTVTLASGSLSDPNVAQTYVYAADFAGFRMFAGQTHTAYSIFYNVVDNTYELYSSLTALSLSAANYWKAGTPTSPLGTFNPQNSATGVLTVATTDAGGGSGDPGVLVPVPNAWAESIFLPIALMRFSGTPAFKNDKALPEITRQYKMALALLKDSKGYEGLTYATYR